VVAGLLRDSVVLCRAFGCFCNGHPASVVVKNQLLTMIEISLLSASSNFEPGGRMRDLVVLCHALGPRYRPPRTGILACAVIVLAT
jgi:hypothetical protein